MSAQSATAITELDRKRPTTAPLQSAEDRRALGAAAIEIDLIKQNMEREIDRLGEIAAGIEALLNGDPVKANGQ